MNTNENITRVMQCWLEKIIIGLNFCPFAQKEFKQQSIRYQVFNGSDLESSLHSLAEEFQYLDNNKKTETTLLIFSQAMQSFDDFLELIDYANQLLDELGYSSVYQLAHFHPDYCFDGVEAEDASNYTNRSPYPTLHLLREQSLQSAIENHPDTTDIPDTNIKCARELGAEKIQNLLDNCKHD